MSILKLRGTRYMGHETGNIYVRYSNFRYITWIDRDPETIARQEALKKRDKLSKDDEERMAEFIRARVRVAQFIRARVRLL